MRTTLPVTPAAMQRLAQCVSRERSEKAWKLAYDTYVAIAPTTDGTAHQWASAKASAVWPLYLPPRRNRRGAP